VAADCEADGGAIDAAPPEPEPLDWDPPLEPPASTGCAELVEDAGAVLVTAAVLEAELAVELELELVSVTPVADDELTADWVDEPRAPDADADDAARAESWESNPEGSGAWMLATARDASPGDCADRNETEAASGITIPMRPARPSIR
jgi:hypothetical protein